MNFLENLENLMHINNIKNINVLSKRSGIPYTTLNNFYIRGTDNIGLSTLKKIASFFNVTLDYLVYGHYTYELSQGEKELIDDYRLLNPQGQEYIMQTIDMAKDKYIKSDSVSNMENID